MSLSGAGTTEPPEATPKPWHSHSSALEPPPILPEQKLLFCSAALARGAAASSSEAVNC